MLDRSIKTEIAPGVMQLTPGSYYKQRDVSVVIPQVQVDEMTRFLESVRAINGAWMLSDLYTEDNLYGWPNDWTITTGRGAFGNILNIQLESIA
jgi:hypothetical protein